jgi:hypothetical protein
MQAEGAGNFAFARRLFGLLDELEDLLACRKA